MVVLCPCNTFFCGKLISVYQSQFSNRRIHFKVSRGEAVRNAFSLRRSQLLFKRHLRRWNDALKDAGHQWGVDGRWTQVGPGSMQLMMIAVKDCRGHSYDHRSTGFRRRHLRHKPVLCPLGKGHQCRGTPQWVLLCC